ncbi:MAG: peptidoglycan-binding protein [Spirosomaceae bacterium]|nr:peptidoglycan-binding protein [Spirosomataceae bacterium]
MPVAAEYATRTRRVLASPATTREIDVPAQFASRTKFICGDEGNAINSGDGSNAMAANNSGCGPKVRSIDVPAEYRSVSKYMVDKQPTTREIDIPAEYKTITRQVVASAAATREVEVPAQYKTITKTVVKTGPATSEVAIPAQTGTYTFTSMTGMGSYADWVEILCESKVTVERIRSIQIALKQRGYDPGPIDNVLGRQTKTALLQFQKDENLPQGNLNLETLKALGISY